MNVFEMFGTITFVSESIAAYVTKERFGSSMFSIVIVQLRLGLEALGADITDEFAIARMKFGMSFQEGCFLKAFVAAFEITNKSLCRPRSRRGCHDGRHAAVAGRGHALDDGHLLTAGGAEYVAAAPARGNDGGSRLASID